MIIPWLSHDYPMIIPTTNQIQSFSNHLPLIETTNHIILQPTTCFATPSKAPPHPPAPQPPGAWCRRRARRGGPTGGPGPCRRLCRAWLMGNMEGIHFTCVCVHTIYIYSIYTLYYTILCYILSYHIIWYIYIYINKNININTNTHININNIYIYILYHIIIVIIIIFYIIIIIIYKVW